MISFSVCPSSTVQSPVTCPSTKRHLANGLLTGYLTTESLTEVLRGFKLHVVGHRPHHSAKTSVPSSPVINLSRSDCRAPDGRV